MGLADRHYMREGSRGVPMSATTLLMIILGVVYALQCINDAYIHSPAEAWLALTPDCFRRGYVWQLLTFQFLHVSLWHLGGNLLVLWWAGHFVEGVLGKRRFLVALFGSGVVGGIFQGVLVALFPEHFGVFTMGASAGISGIFAIFAMLEKNSEIRLYFVLPIRAITLLWVSGAISLFFTLVPTPREWGMAHAAHLGGILAGVAWVKLGWHRDYEQLPWEGWFSGRARRGKRESGKPSVGKLFGKSQEDEPAETSQESFISREVDPILDKISKEGIQSLTDHERRVLEAARNKMAKR